MDLDALDSTCTRSSICANIMNRNSYRHRCVDLDLDLASYVDIYIILLRRPKEPTTVQIMYDSLIIQLPRILVLHTGTMCLPRATSLLSQNAKR